MRLRKEGNEFLEEEVLLIAKVSDGLAHPLRVRLLRHIMNENIKRTPVCNGDLVNAFNYSQSTISQHMKVLEKSGLVQVQKKNRFSYYYVNIGLLSKYLEQTKRLK
ncbi:MAG: metalloregulator ArsR/SmtB family transcription factor [Anaerovoracaceae bacterium]|nr:winged helix-turn-helix transcriptional regulator [Clostridiales bacterium]